jgi:HAD superfamily hydrolase (TIGR01549 family)
LKFYRRFSPIKAISFDLDDTLYSNKPVMQAIEKKMIAYFSDTLNAHKFKPNILNQNFSQRFWYQFRQQAISQQANLSHDVVQVRLVSYRLGLEQMGFTASIAQQMAQKALDYFISLRSDFTVPESSKQFLANLSGKYPLVAISNGNVDTKTLGIAHYFQHIYHAGWQKDGSLFKQKPAKDMFEVACQKLAIKPQQLLHVGDCGRADIQGALSAGCQTAWFSCYDVGQPLKVVPHIEITALKQLEQL